MKILIYGANGWIGGQFIQLLNDVEYVCGKSRVDNENELKNENNNTWYCIFCHYHYDFCFLF